MFMYLQIAVCIKNIFELLSNQAETKNNKNTMLKNIKIMICS